MSGAAEQATVRLDRMVSVAEAATAAAIELPMSQGYSWYAPWSIRLLALRQQVQRAITQSNSGAWGSRLHPQRTNNSSVSERLDEWIGQCDEVWAWPDWENSAEIADRHDDPAPWDLAQAMARNWTYCVADGDVARLTLDLAADSATTSQQQTRCLYSIIGLAVATILLAASPGARDLFCRCPLALAFLAGLAYWAWLSPSWLGLAIAAGSLWLAIRPGWPGRSMRSEGSTVLRAGDSP